MRQMSSCPTEAFDLFLLGRQLQLPPTGSVRIGIRSESVLLEYSRLHSASAQLCSMLPFSLVLFIQASPDGHSSSGGEPEISVIQ